jgi:hypothetical protein
MLQLILTYNPDSFQDAVEQPRSHEVRDHYSYGTAIFLGSGGGQAQDLPTAAVKVLFTPSDSTTDT